MTHRRCHIHCSARGVLFLVLVLSVAISSSAVAQTIEEPSHSLLHNSFRSIRIVDSFALATTQTGLAVLQEDPASGRYAEAHHLLLPTDPSALKTYDTVALVLSVANLAYLVDISALPMTSLLATIDLEGPVHDVAFHDHDLYVAAGFGGVLRYDLTDLSAPTYADSSQMGVHCTQVEVTGNDLYVLDDYNGILRYDLAGAGFGTYDTTLLLPKQAYNFTLVDSTTVYVPLMSYEEAYRGVFGESVVVLTDTIPLLGLGDRILAIDDYVAILLDDGTLEVRNLSQLDHPWLWLTLDSITNGDGAVADNGDGPALVLPAADGGLLGYEFEELWQNYEPAERYDRPGPTSALANIDNRLHVGGARNPYEIFSLAADLTPTRDTAYRYLTGVQSMATTQAGVAVSLHNPNLLRSLAFAGDTIVSLAVFPTGSAALDNLQWRQVFAADTVAGVFGVSDSSVLSYRVTDSGMISPAGAAGVIGQVADFAIIDSFLLVLDNNRQIYGYRIGDDYGLLPRWTIGAPADAWHIISLDGGTGLLFTSTALYTIDLFGDDLPTVGHLTAIETDVAASVIADGLLYGVGSRGISVYDITVSPPELIASGGMAGNELALVDSSLAVTDGQAIWLYDLRDILGSPGLSPVDSSGATEIPMAQLTNYPNPFNPRTTISFSLSQPGDVDLTVLNVLGQHVATVASGYYSSGQHDVAWEGANDGGAPVASGVYLYRLTTNEITVTRKMVLVR